MENKVDMSLEEFRQRERAASLMADELDTLRAENERLKAMEIQFKNLLAVMHRDGGHHLFAVGIDQAVLDAIEAFYELIRQLTEYKLDEYKQDALRWRFYASSPQTAFALGTKLDLLTEQDWKAECDRLADAAIKGANHDNA